MDLFMAAAVAEAKQGLAEGGIPRVVVGENRTFMGEEELLHSRGVTVEVLQDETCMALMNDFIRVNPGLWHEDIGV